MKNKTKTGKINRRGGLKNTKKKKYFLPQIYPNKYYEFSHHFDIVNTGETPYKYINKHISWTIWKEMI